MAGRNPSKSNVTDAARAATEPCPPRSPRAPADHLPPIDTGRSTLMRKLVACVSFVALLLLSGYTLHHGLDRLTSPAVASTPAQEPAAPRYRTQPIETIRPGQTVLAMDTEAGEIREQRVIDAFSRTADHLRVLKIRATDGSEQTLHTTGRSLPLGDAAEVRSYWESRLTGCQWTTARSGTGKVDRHFLVEFELVPLMPERTQVDFIILTVRSIANNESLFLGLQHICEPKGWRAIYGGEGDEGSEYLYHPNMR